MTGFFEVLLRGVTLSGLAVAVGGVVFVVAVLRPFAEARPLVPRSLVLISMGAASAAVAQALMLAFQVVALTGGREWPLAELAATTYFRVTIISIVTAIVLAVVAGARGGGRPWTKLILAAALVACSAGKIGRASCRERG